jgi:hypothetical protein
MAKVDPAELAKSVLKKKTPKKGRPGEGGAEAMLGDDFKETIKLFEKQLVRDAELVAQGKTPIFKTPEQAAKYWDDMYAEMAKNMKSGMFPVGPAAEKITYRKDGQLFSLNRDVKPPAGAERVSLTDADLLKMMPPRPRISAGEAKAPNAYNNPPPPDYIRPPTSTPSAAPRASVAASEYAAPGAAAPAPAATNPTIDLARETVGGPRGTVPPVNTRPARTPPPSGPWGTKDIPTREPSNLAVYGGPAALGAAGIGAGVYAGYNPEGAAQTGRDIFNAVTGGTDVVPNDRTESPNPDMIPYMGPGVSAQPDDFRDSGLQYPQPQGVSFDASDFAPNGGMMDGPMTPPAPEYSGRELGAGDPRFTGPGVSYDKSDFYPNAAVSTARKVIANAQNTPQAQAQRAAAVLQQSPNELTVQKRPEQGPSFMTQLLRGDFREDADQRIAEAMRRQREESGVGPGDVGYHGMASGGAASKKTNKDDVLHKALEIIHHMLTRR